MKDKNTADTTQEADRKAQTIRDEKKPPFKKPELVVHGSITELTAFTGSGSV